MQAKFLKTIMNYDPGTEESLDKRLYAINMSILPIAVSVVIFVSLYWIIADKVIDTYNLTNVAKLGVYAQLLASIYMLVLSFVYKKTSIVLQRISFILFYVTIIIGVAILGITRNIKIIDENAISDYVGVSVSAFYMFIIVFMPLPGIVDSAFIIIMMAIGLLSPEILFRTSSYSFLSHIILFLGFSTAYYFFKRIQLNGIKHEISINKMSDELMTDSVIDTLTTALNRRAMDTYIKYLLENSDKKCMGVIFFDIDYFKKYNDYYGHVTGDIALKKVAVAAMESLGDFEGTYLFRYGGEEFVVLIDGADERTIKEVMTRIRNEVYAAKIERSDISIFDRITITMGGAIERMPNISGDYVVGADTQLYLGKKGIRNSAYFDGKRIDIRGPVEDKKHLSDEVNTEEVVKESRLLRDNEALSLEGLMEAITGELNAIFSINIRSKSMTTYQIKENMTSLELKEDTKTDYEESAKLYLTQYVHPNDRQQIEDVLDTDKLCENLKKSKTVTRYYRVIENGGIKNYQLRCLRMGPAADFDTVLFLVIEENSEFSMNPSASRLENDELTGVYTKQAFMYHAREIIDANPNMEYSIAINDIENFKLINTVYGEHEGDRVLKYVANAYNEYDRCVICGRYGADQFVMLVKADVNARAKGIDAELKGIAEKAPVPYLVIKMGIYSRVDHCDSIATMCDKATLALKRVKHNYSMNVDFYDGKVLQQHYKAQLYESNFERALEEKEFVVWCQPKRQAASERIWGAEALVRWATTDGTFITPNEFIPVFEETGLIVKLDQYVFRTVCERLKEHMDAGMEILPISVNMSRSTLYHPDTIDIYSSIAKEYRIPIDKVPIEITESYDIDSGELKERIDQLRKAGFKILLDDFGIGYSSLSNFSELALDGVKFDKSFVNNIGTVNGDEIIKHLIGLAHFLKMIIIAEGVENEKQLEFLRGQECDLIQGYYFNRPMPFSDYEKLLTGETQ